MIRRLIVRHIDRAITRVAYDGSIVPDGYQTSYGNGCVVQTAALAILVACKALVAPESAGS